MAKPVLRNRQCEDLGIEYPIFLPGMAGRGDPTPPEMVAAESEAGGMGVLGTSGFEPDEIRRRIREVRKLTDKPFGVDCLLPVRHVDAAPTRSGVREQIKKEYPAHAQGTKLMGIAGNVRHAHRQIAAGTDIVIAAGHEGGGHVGPIGTFPLIPQIVDAIAPAPVAAAGGIGDSRGVAAALALGAQAIWVGTAFLVADECAIPDARSLLKRFRAE